MINDLPGKFLGIAIAFILVVVAPFVNTTIEDEMVNRRLIINDVTNFIDEVVDSRTITDGMIDELNVNLASHGMAVDYEITHYARSVDPDPTADGEYYITYLEQDPVDGEYNFAKGDKISVRVYVVGYSTTESLSHKLTGMFVKDLDETITARIR